MHKSWKLELKNLIILIIANLLVAISILFFAEEYAKDRAANLNQQIQQLIKDGKIKIKK